MDISETTLLNAPVDAVFEIMATTAFQDAKASALNALEYRSDVSVMGGEIKVVGWRVIPALDVPEFIKAMVEPTIAVTETEVWSPPTGSGRSGSFTVEVKGAPIRVAGTVCLLAEQPGCRVTFAGELRTSVPLFKSAIERAAAQQVIKTIITEFDLLHDTLNAFSPASDGGI